jgi:putative acetyltransferase
LRILAVKTKQELEMVKNLFVEYADSLGFDLDFQNFDKELTGLPGQYCSPRGCILLAEYENQPAGCVALRPLSGEICEMKRLYVRPQFRGLGIGKALAEAIIEQARKIGYTLMRLDTVGAMKVARALYQSLDFKQISQYMDNPIEGAEFMELKLS